MQSEDIKPGRYVVAVSGGVDSVVLLHMLTIQPKLELIVAHFDHGIRDDSAKDRLFVQNLAKKYKLKFEYANGKLGKKASELQARKARYSFLNQVAKENDCRAIITAHHQDDVLETVIMNLLRGTGRKGLSSLKSSKEIIRPLLSFSKLQIIDYARVNKLKWREDSTNSDTKYFRNWLRLKIVPKLTANQRQKILQSEARMLKVNYEVDNILDKFINETKLLDRQTIIMLPHKLAKELIAHWLRKNLIADFDSFLIEKIVIDSKTFANGKKTSVKKGVDILFTKTHLLLIRKNQKN